MKPKVEAMRGPAFIATVTVFLLAAILHAHAADAATYYVATNGSNTNPGTVQSPFQTIAKGLSSLKAGDVLYLRGGTYSQSINSNSQVIPTGTSWANAPLVSAYPGETVV